MSLKLLELCYLFDAMSLGGAIPIYVPSLPSAYIRNVSSFLSVHHAAVIRGLELLPQLLSSKTSKLKPDSAWDWSQIGF